MSLAELTKTRLNLDAELEICIRQLITAVTNGSTKAIRGLAIESFGTYYKDFNAKRAEVQKQIDILVQKLVNNQKTVEEWPPAWIKEEDLMDEQWNLDKMEEVDLTWYDSDKMREKIDAKQEKSAQSRAKSQ